MNRKKLSAKRLASKWKYGVFKKKIEKIFSIFFENTSDFCGKIMNRLNSPSHVDLCIFCKFEKICTKKLRYFFQGAGKLSKYLILINKKN